MVITSLEVSGVITASLDDKSPVGVQPNALLDLSALGFWRRGGKAFFDIRMFDPVALSHFNQNLQAAYLRQENEKKRR